MRSTTSTLRSIGLVLALTSGAFGCSGDDAQPTDAGAGTGGTAQSGASGSGGMTAMTTGGSTATSHASGGSGGRDAGKSGSGGSGGMRTPIDGGGSNEPTGSGGMSAAVDAGDGNACDAPNLKWKSARKTNYTSYPDPGSEECIKYNGCEWEGQFAGCDGKQTKDWVAMHNIAAAFPDFGSLELHDLCLRAGDKTIVVTVYDTCGDSDCDGCCTENQGDADQLIDLESYTNARWGVEDGTIEWADLGPTKSAGCD